MTATLSFLVLVPDGDEPPAPTPAAAISARLVLSSTTRTGGYALHAQKKREAKLDNARSPSQFTDGPQVHIGYQMGPSDGPQAHSRCRASGITEFSAVAAADFPE